jgi:Na+/phosphate symporter
MARELETIWDLEGKIDWEGGYDEAISYGIKIDDYDVSEELKEAWDNMVSLYGDYEEAVDLVDELIRAEKKEKSNNDD